MLQSRDLMALGIAVALMPLMVAVGRRHAIGGVASRVMFLTAVQGTYYLVSRLMLRLC